MGKGALDEKLRMSNLLRADVDYERPPGGGKALLDLAGDLRGKRILDLGCGLGTYRRPIEERGARWIGLDLSGRACTVIGDGASLPFRDASLDGALAAAVFEHLPDPDLILRELRRTLVPGGVLFGYVAFLEPFHGISFFHMSHMGLEYLFLKHGFRPRRIYPSHPAVSYQLEQILFPKPVPVLQPLVRAVSRSGAHCLLALNRWSRECLSLLRRLPGPERREERRRYRQLLALRHAIGFNFVAVREETPDVSTSGYRALVKEG